MPEFFVLCAACGPTFFAWEMPSLRLAPVLKDHALAFAATSPAWSLVGPLVIILSSSFRLPPLFSFIDPSCHWH